MVVGGILVPQTGVRWEVFNWSPKHLGDPRWKVETPATPSLIWKVVKYRVDVYIDNLKQLHCAPTWQLIRQSRILSMILMF